MEKFAFRLQKVLDHRMTVEDIKKRAFVKSRLKYLKEEKNLKCFKDKFSEHIAKPVKSTGIVQYIANFNYISLLKERIDEQEKVVKLIEDEMNIKRKEMEDSKKDRKVMDKLKEKAKFQYDISVDRVEQKQNDEFGLYSYMKADKFEGR